MVAPVAHAHQIENHEFDPRRRWRKAAVRRWSDLPEIVDHPVSLWGGGDSTRYGLHDRITQEAATNFGTSLWLVRPHRVRIHLLTRGELFEKPKKIVRAAFSHGYFKYDFPVTDPSVERALHGRPDGLYRMHNEAYFCVSLTEHHEGGYCYKLVAAIFTEEPLVLE